MRERRTFLERVERSTRLIRIAVRHGYGSLLVRAGWTVPSEEGETVATLTAEQFRDALAEAGVTFVKLGQKLSSRPDLLPEEYVRALSSLQEDVPKPPVDELLDVLREELGRPAAEVFAEFDREPVASASIGVVFRAKLPEPDNRWVAVKVQRPAIAQQVATDLHILADLAAGLERHVPAVRRYQPARLVREFRESLHAELDYVEEAAKTRRLREALSQHEGVAVPEVLMHLTTTRVLTTEWVDGIPVAGVPDLKLPEIDTRRVAANLARSLLRQALEEGCFHNDPHPGNLRVLRNGRAVFLDFGSVTYIGRAAREHMQRLLGAMFLQRSDLVVTMLVNAGVLRAGVDVTRFEHDVDRLLARHFGSDGPPRFDALIGDFLRLVFVYEDLALPSEWVSLLQAICILEGSCRRLDPAFSLIGIGRELTQRNLLEQVDLRRWFQEHLLTAQGFSELVAGLPGRAERLLTRLESGDLKVQHEHSNADRFWRPLGRIVNRLTGGIVLSALVLASALMASRSESGFAAHLWQGMLALSAVAGAVLLWSILRSGGLRR